MLGNGLGKLVRSQIVDGLKMCLDFILSVMESCWGIGDSCELISEKAMAPHSSTLAWKTPWMEEPCRLQSMESLGVGHYRATSL